MEVGSCGDSVDNSGSCGCDDDDNGDNVLLQLMTVEILMLIYMLLMSMSEEKGWGGYKTGSYDGKAHCDYYYYFCCH